MWHCVEILTSPQKSRRCSRETDGMNGCVNLKEWVEKSQEATHDVAFLTALVTRLCLGVTRAIPRLKNCQLLVSQTLGMRGTYNLALTTALNATGQR